MRPVAVVGSLARDVVDGGPPRVGGAPYYAALALRELNRSARIVTKCAGADREELLPAVVGLGVPVTWQPSGETPAFAFHYEDEQRIMRIEATGEPWSAEDARTWARPALASVRWIHVAPLLRDDFPAAVLGELGRGRRISFDGQGLVRVRENGPLRLEAAPDPTLLRHVTVLKLAEEEAEALLGRITQRAVDQLGVPEVVVTRGSRGCILYAGGEEQVIRAHPLPNDPTGAGDAFAAAYVAGRAAGFAPAGAARRATAVVGTLLRSRR